MPFTIHLNMGLAEFRNAYWSMRTMSCQINQLSERLLNWLVQWSMNRYCPHCKYMKVEELQCQVHKAYSYSTCWFCRYVLNSETISSKQASKNLVTANFPLDNWNHYSILGVDQAQILLKTMLTLELQWSCKTTKTKLLPPAVCVPSNNCRREYLRTVDAFQM